jgi:anti-sigma factor RsiW
MNHCADIGMRSPLYLSGEMEAEERVAFAAHIATCSICAAKIAEDRNLDATLRSALAFAPDTGRLEEATGRLEQALRRKISVERRRRNLAWAGAVAAAMALMAVGTLAWERWTRPPQWYADAALDHRTEVIERQPRHWRSSETELAGLAAQNGLDLGQVTALAAAGYRLERAKICGIGGRRMLHLVFSSGRRRYSVFVSPHLGPVETVRTSRRGAEQIAGFETGHFRGLVVSDGSAAECKEFAHAAERRL